MRSGSEAMDLDSRENGCLLGKTGLSMTATMWGCGGYSSNVRFSVYNERLCYLKLASRAKYVRGGNPQPRNGKVIGHIIDYVYVPLEEKSCVELPAAMAAVPRKTGAHP